MRVPDLYTPMIVAFFVINAIDVNSFLQLYNNRMKMSLTINKVRIIIMKIINYLVLERHYSII